MQRIGSATSLNLKLCTLRKIWELMHFPITNTNPLSHSFLVRKKPIVYNILFIWWWTYMTVWHTLHEMGARDTLSIWWDLHTLLVSNLKDILCMCVVDFKFFFFFFFFWESFNLWHPLLMIALLSPDQDTNQFLV